MHDRPHVNRSVVAVVSHESGALVVISDATTGIGEAAARVLADKGYHVLAGVHSDREARAVRPRRIEPVILDVTHSAHVAVLAERVDGDPRRSLRTVINNAGIEINAPVEVQPLDVWRHHLEVNVVGHVAITQALLPALRRSRGTVVNISSVGGEVALPIFGSMRRASSRWKPSTTGFAARSGRRGYG